MLKFISLFFCASAALIGIDLGSELVKISLIRPGKKLIIVENEQSKRSTPFAIAFTENGREYGYNALKEQGKRPEQVLTFTHNLFSNNSVSHYNRIFAPISFSINSERQSLLISIKGKELELEEVVAMMLEHFKEMAEIFSGNTIKDCAITVPSFWNRDTRIQLINAAQVAGLNVLTLVNENTAAAYYYGLDRLDEEKDVFVVFYNLGASYLQSTVVKYSAVNTTVGNGSKAIENVQILAQTHDSTLGGSTFDSLLADYLAEKFEETHKLSIKDNKKVMNRIFLQANLAKKVLSANRVTLVILNSLYKGIDFNYNLKREEFESILEKFSERLIKPVTDALQTANITQDQISFLEILGGASRIPKIQELLKQKLGFDSSTHLNGDEAMAHGSVLLAGNFSSKVQVKPIWVSDVLMNKLTARFLDIEKRLIEEVTIFEKNSEIGTAYYHSLSYDRNFTVELFEGEEKRPLGYYEVSGFENVTVSEYKVVLVFAIDHSGIGFLYKVDAGYIELVNKNVTYFDEEEVKEQENKEEGKKEDKSDEKGEYTIEISNEDTEVKSDKPKTPKRKLKSKVVPTNETRLIPLKHAFKHNGVPRLLTGTELKDIRTKISEYKAAEIAAKKLSEAKNNIESYIYSLREKLDESSFETVTTNEERQSLAELVAMSKDWMESDEFSTASLENVTEKRQELENNFKDPFERESELQIREPTVNKAKKDLKRLEGELLLANSTKPWLSAEELNSTWKILNDTLDWIKKKSDEQKILELWKPLAFTSAEVEQRVKTVENLVEKIKRMVKPKPKKPYKPDFMNFDDNFDWEKFKEKYEKEKAEKKKNEKEENDLNEEAAEQENEEKSENADEGEKTDL